jgi:ABC-type multidrug transport system fused ATPase/permease subunit
LFSGTVRDNLDPFNEHTDEALYDALSRVNLGPKDTPEVSRAPSRVPSKPQLAIEDGEDGPSRADSTLVPNKKVVITLSTEVSAGGSNFSQGQRQLVAMARALLRRSNLIVRKAADIRQSMADQLLKIMDEATASVDFATDETIQQSIRTEFKSSTLLTIAHRLSSVIDYDRLLVLADGGVAEFDTPAILLRKEGGLFRSLAEKSGKFKDLVRAAEKKEEGK